jgi:hypothetical protein
MQPFRAFETTCLRAVLGSKKKELSTEHPYNNGIPVIQVLLSG